MVQFRRVAKASFVVLMLSIMKASCYIGTSGKTTSSILQSDVSIDQNISDHGMTGSNSLEHLAEHISNNFVNHMVSALQTESASFIQTNSQFDFKAIAKQQAENLLKEVLKNSLLPVEQTVAESVSPPTVNPHLSKLIKMGLKELFNRAEKYAGVDVSDSIWEDEENESENEVEDEEETEEEEEEADTEESDE